MFNAYEFVFNGESSAMYGLMLYDFGGTGQSNVSFGNGASIVESTTNNRINPVHLGVNYHTKPLEFKLVFGADRELDRYELESVAMWLTGHQDYKWLSIEQPDLGHVQYRCLVTSLTPLSHGWLPVAFEATFRCDCPYGYGFDHTISYPINGVTQILYRNDSSIREYLRPTMIIQPCSGVQSVKIVNHSDNGREFLLDNLPASDLNIHVDNALGVIQELNHNYNLYDEFNQNFFRIVQGDNVLEVIGNGTLSITSKFLYNIGG